jgi:hypothetical protein
VLRVWLARKKLPNYWPKDCASRLIQGAFVENKVQPQEENSLLKMERVYKELTLCLLNFDPEVLKSVTSTNTSSCSTSVKVPIMNTWFSSG